MGKERGAAAFRFLNGLPTCFAMNLGARFRSGEVAEKAVSKGLVVVDHRGWLLGAGRDTHVLRCLLRRIHRGIQIQKITRRDTGLDIRINL